MHPLRFSLVTSLLLACGAVEVPAQDAPVPPAPATSATQAATHEEACQAFFRKLGALPVTCPLARPARFEPLFVETCLAVVTAPGSQVTPAAMLADCVQRIDDCNIPEACQAYQGASYVFSLAGTLAAGEPCLVNLQCASGRCSGRYEDDTCGVCQELRGDGEACSPPAFPCDSGASCEGGVCVPHGKKLGEDCIAYGGGDCQASLCCDASAGDGLHGFCKPRGQPGQDCDDHVSLCLDGLVCAAGVCVERRPDGASCGEQAFCVNHCVDGVCRSPDPDGQKLGESCGYFPCRPGLACSPEKRCEQAILAREGEDCTVNPCAPDLLCSYGYLPGAIARRCVGVPGVGEPCADLRCAPGLICHDVSLGKGNPGTCVPRGDEGEPCPCIGELVCDQDVCRRHAAECRAP